MSPFPERPATAYKTSRRFLSLFEVPGWRQVYVLGCYARYVTIYAQQVRALNLIHFLATNGVLSSRTRLAVVGGGIAGITAAAGAIKLGVLNVDIFEREVEGVLRLQETSQQRFVHPHIYDWPDQAAGEPKALLPVLPWSADWAANVRDKIHKGWLETAKVAHVQQFGKPEGMRRRPRGACLTIEGDPKPKAYDVVVLAVGFGSDHVPGTETDGYWTDSRIDGKEVTVETGDWIVSGTGDGALTDLMRLCIRGFRHQQVLSAFDRDDCREIFKNAGEDLLNAERSSLTRRALAARYLKAASAIRPYLDREPRLQDRPIPSTVWLNAKPSELFQPRASVLNRLIVAYLFLTERFKFVPKRGRIRPQDINAANGLVDVKFLGLDAPIPAKHIILRHGPQAATTFAASFPEIHEAFLELADTWKSVRQHDDWTKTPLFASGVFDTARTPLRIDFGDEPGCITIGRREDLTSVNLPGLARDSLELFRTFRGVSVDLNVAHFNSLDVFGSTAAYERAVRALCHSPFAVFDLSGYDPAVMILLGIRSAVRRGATLTVTENPVDSLPFNIGRITPLQLNEGNVQRLAEAMMAATGAMLGQPASYLDLPVFDSLRRVGTDSRPISYRQKVLLLGWFDKPYRALVAEKIAQEFKTRSINNEIVTTLDTKSPQLVDQRLYALIRFAELCVIDWTGWRPNVFFEMGVRLAVNPNDMVHIVYDQSHESSDQVKKILEVRPKDSRPDTDSEKVLREFFAPTPFRLVESAKLRQRLGWFIDGGPAPAASQLPILPSGATFAAVLEALDSAGEAAGTSIHSFLETHATSFVRSFVPESGDLVHVLFADAFADQAKRRALEALLAAWFYLEGCHDLAKKRFGGRLGGDHASLWAQLEELYVKIEFLFSEVNSPDYSYVRRKLKKVMRPGGKL